MCDFGVDVDVFIWVGFDIVDVDDVGIVGDGLVDCVFGSCVVESCIFVVK